MEKMILELLTKMYSEFTDFRKETKADIMELRSEIKELRADVEVVKSEVQKLTEKVQSLECEFVEFKSETTNKLDALFDGYKQTYELEKLNSEKLDIITLKFENHDVQIKALKRKKTAGII